MFPKLPYFVIPLFSPRTALCLSNPKGIEIYKIPSPRVELRQLFKLSGVPVPMVLPKVRGGVNADGAGRNVDTGRKLPSRRKP